MVRDSLRQLDGYEVENVRDQELLTPVRERAVAPVLAGLHRSAGGSRRPATSITSGASSSALGVATTPDASTASSPSARRGGRLACPCFI